MGKIDSNLLEEAEKFVVDLLMAKVPEGLLYHSPEHSRYVVNASEMIGKESSLNQQEIDLAKITAWFHDVGYAISTEDHETESKKLAEQFLSSKGIDPSQIKEVTESIEATRIPQSPRSKIAEVVCDADMLHLSSPDYYDQANHLRKEQAFIHHQRIRKQDFDILSLAFFKAHTYHTNYGKTVLQIGKEKNYNMIQKKVEKRKKNTEDKVTEINDENSKLKKKLEKKKGYSRGVESMFRLTARNQINLSSIADNKSNILISVNTIIISIVLTVLVSRFAELPHMILPSLIFLTFSLITIIFAILSTRPNISSGRFTKEDIKQKKVNLLFFGNFYNMGLEDYNWALDEMMKDDDYLYSTMIKDQYFLGVVLAKKYKLLRWAYNFFMVGLVVSVIAYMLAFTNL